MRDAYHHRLFSGTGIETQDYKPCVLFLNGEFWGYHGIRENYNKHYFNSYYDVDKDDIDFISEGPSDILPGGVFADEPVQYHSSAELTHFPWSGDYFEEVAIQLKAANKIGFRFVEWAGDVSSTDMEISILPVEGMNIIAVFEPLAQSVTLNELLASNSNYNSDAAGEFDDWIELYNTTSSTVDLSGYFLSDDAMDLQKWTFPAGTAIEENGFLIVWADKDDDQLSKSGYRFRNGY